jgi:ABC-type transport system substrate-binding protein
MRPESRAQASDRGCGQPHGRVQAVRRLPHAADRHMIGVREPVNGESREGVRMRGARSVFAGLTVGIALAVPGPAAAENVLRWSSIGGAATIDPHAYDEGTTFAQHSQVYEGLIGVDSTLELVPRLAVAWRLVEPTIWEFELRPNVLFHDGTPLTNE